MATKEEILEGYTGDESILARMQEYAKQECAEKDEYIKGWMEKFNEKVGEYKTARAEIERLKQLVINTTKTDVLMMQDKDREIKRIKSIVAASLEQFANCYTEVELHKAITILKTI